MHAYTKARNGQAGRKCKLAPQASRQHVQCKADLGCSPNLMHETRISNQETTQAKGRSQIKGWKRKTIKRRRHAHMQRRGEGRKGWKGGREMCERGERKRGKKEERERARPPKSDPCRHPLGSPTTEYRGPHTDRPHCPHTIILHNRKPCLLLQVPWPAAFTYTSTTNLCQLSTCILVFIAAARFVQ
jgi:hypothetical protein